MAGGLILFWVVIGGSLTPTLRNRLVPRLAAIPMAWRVRFVLLCTAMARSWPRNCDEPGWSTTAGGSSCIAQAASRSSCHSGTAVSTIRRGQTTPSSPQWTRIMNDLFFQGANSTPGGLKPSYLKDQGHGVLNPALPDDDFNAPAEFDQDHHDVVVGSSRGGAVASDTPGPALPGVVDLGHSDHREAEHHDPAQPGGRDSAVCRFRGTGQEQRFGIVGVGAGWNGSPVGGPGIVGEDVGSGGEGTWVR